MASLFDMYGIKEVADVTLYEIGDKGVETPVMYFDTLKVSTIEESASNTSANGGKGNAKLVSWDYGKEITLNLEDALFSPQSLALMHGSQVETVTTHNLEKTFFATVPAIDTDYKFEIPRMIANLVSGETAATVKVSVPALKETFKATLEASDNGGKIVKVTASDAQKGKEPADVLKKVEGEKAIITLSIPQTNHGDNKVIRINADTFPKVYKVVGDTYIRNRDTGNDEFFQFIVPRAKMSPSVSITMQADGDPSTFSMSMQVLRPTDGEMMKLVAYPNIHYTGGNLEKVTPATDPKV